MERDNAEGPAPDGEEYFAMALFFASARWGDGEGIFAYSKEAQGNPAGMYSQRGAWTSAENLCGSLPIMLIKVCHKHGFFSDPSYHLPHFYELVCGEGWRKKTGNSGDRLRQPAENICISACHPQDRSQRRIRRL